MKTKRILAGVAVLMLGVGGVSGAEPAAAGAEIQLPPPAAAGGMALTEAIAKRRSVRMYAPEPLTMDQVGQLLWAAQGITDPRGLRAAPSAGATYPLELYVLLPDGLYHYQPTGHKLVKRLAEDRRAAVAEAALRQPVARSAPALFLFAEVSQRTAARYRDRARRYIDMEAGHAAQNLALQAVALGLGSVMIGAMDDDLVQKALDLPREHQVLYLVPVGRPVP